MTKIFRVLEVLSVLCVITEKMVTSNLFDNIVQKPNILVVELIFLTLIFFYERTALNEQLRSLIWNFLCSNSDVIAFVIINKQELLQENQKASAFLVSLQTNN